MKLNDIATKLGLRDLTPEVRSPKDAEISRGYASDLLSDVLANGPAGGILITVQAHINVVAVAIHAGLVAVVFANNRLPDEAVRLKAAEEGLQLYASRDGTFDIAGRMHGLGVGGRA